MVLNVVTYVYDLYQADFLDAYIFLIPQVQSMKKSY